MSAGKGDRPRNNYSQEFRDNWEIAFGKKKAKKETKRKKKESK